MGGAATPSRACELHWRRTRHCTRHRRMCHVAAARSESRSHSERTDDETTSSECATAPSDATTARASRQQQKKRAVDPWKSSARTHSSIVPDTRTTALALRPPETALSPLMSRLNARTRTFVYPKLCGMRLTVRQNWNDGDAIGTGAAVWDAATVLADNLASDGAFRALRKAGLVRALDDDAANELRAKRWWRGATVIELGAGLGVVSMVAAALGARVLATDGDDAVCAACARVVRDNARTLEAYGERVMRDEPRKLRSTRSTVIPGVSREVHPPGVLRVFWGDYSDIQNAREWIQDANVLEAVDFPIGRSRETNPPRSACFPHAILLADALYGENETVWEALVETVHALAGPETIVVLSHTERGRGNAARVFLKRAKDLGFAAWTAETKSIQVDGFAMVTATFVLRLKPTLKPTLMDRGERMNERMNE